jgi:hypothetical protein
MAEQNSPSLLPYVAGSLGVWTLMDYFGEAAGTGTSSWPAVSSNFGQFDIAGFPKSNALWYSVNWLEAAQDAGRPALARRTVARILDLPDRLSSLKPVVSAVTSAPKAELVVDGTSMGVQRTPRDQFGQLAKITWELPGKAAAVPNQCTGPESFPHNASMVQCMGLEFVATASDPESCAKACCASHLCNTWQFDTSNLAKGCWIGSAAVASCQDPPEGNKGVKMIGGQSALPCDPHFDKVTLRALDEEGQVLATHTLRSPTCSGKRQLRLTMDVPSEATGTGRTLVLDGRDTGLLRASVVEPRPRRSSVPGLFLAADDEELALVSTATDRMTWKVVSGPGRIVGVSSGNEASHEWLKSNSVAAYGGLARGFVQVTKDCVSEHRDLAASIDLDSGRSRVSLANSCEEDSIIVEASAEGFESVRMVVPVVADMNESPLAVAERSAQGLKFAYLDEFLG